MTVQTLSEMPTPVIEALRAGRLAPYLGPAMLSLCPEPSPPASPLALAVLLTSRVSVPGKIRHRLTAAAQFIENFKHRKTLVSAMNDAYAATPVPSSFHRWIAALPAPLLVHAWYDDTVRASLSGRTGWAEVQGLSQSEHFGTWTGWYLADGTPSPVPVDVRTVLYRPWGGCSPAGNYLVSDSDFVEVLTEIDIQTPIPAVVQARRSTLGFVFFGCRFDDQLPRAFARQILKRSGGPHFAVLPDEPTRMEDRFLEEMSITRIAAPLAAVAAALMDASAVDEGLPA